MDINDQRQNLRKTLLYEIIQGAVDDSRSVNELLLVLDRTAHEKDIYDCYEALTFIRYKTELLLQRIRVGQQTSYLAEDFGTRNF